MNTALFYGIVLALANIVLSLVGYFLGFQTDKIALEPWYGLLNLVAMAVVLWLGIRAAREEAGDKSLSFGKGVRTGFGISLYSGLLGMVYAVIWIMYINPAYADYKVDATRPKWIQAGYSDAKMAAAERGVRFILTPVPLAIYVLILNLLLGVIFALIIAAFLKRAPSSRPLTAS